VCGVGTVARVTVRSSRRQGVTMARIDGARTKLLVAHAQLRTNTPSPFCTDVL